MASGIRWSDSRQLKVRELAGFTELLTTGCAGPVESASSHAYDLYVARLFVMIGARSNQYIFAFFSRRISARSKFAEGRTSPQSSPGTAALQSCESSASRLAVPSSLYRGLLPSRTVYEQQCPVHASEKGSSAPAFGLRSSSFTQRVYSQLANV